MIEVILNGTDNLTDGTIEVGGERGDGSSAYVLILAELNTVYSGHLRVPAGFNGYANAEAITANAPAGHLVSSDGVNYGATAVFGIGTVTGINSAKLRIKQTNFVASAEGGMTFTPRLAAVAIADVEAPSQVANLIATGGSGQINLSWNAATDNVGVNHYDIDGSDNGTTFSNLSSSVTGTTYAETGLGAGVTRYYRVRAVDAKSNLGAWSATANATTSAIALITSTAVFHDGFADGNITANPAWTVDLGSPTVVSGALRFDNNTAYCHASADATFTHPAILSWKHRVTSSDLSYENRAAMLDAAANLVLVAYKNGSNCYLWHKNGATDEQVGAYFTATVASATWYNYSLVWTDAALSFYQNDNLVAIGATNIVNNLTQVRLLVNGTAPAGTTRDYDDVLVMPSVNIACNSVPAGYKFKVRDSGASIVATGTNSGGTPATVILDMTGKCAFPYYDVIITDGFDNIVHTLVGPTRTICGHTVTGILSGDTYSCG